MLHAREVKWSRTDRERITDTRRWIVEDERFTPDEFQAHVIREAGGPYVCLQHGNRSDLGDPCDCLRAVMRKKGEAV